MLALSVSAWVPSSTLGHVALRCGPRFCSPSWRVRPSSDSREDFCLSLRIPRSPGGYVRHCYTVEPDNYCDGTFTRMVSVRSGCPLPRMSSADGVPRNDRSIRRPAA